MGQDEYNKNFKMKITCKDETNLKYEFFEGSDAECKNPIQVPGIIKNYNNGYFVPSEISNGKCFHSSVDKINYLMGIKKFVNFPNGDSNGELSFNLSPHHQ